MPDTLSAELTPRRGFFTRIAAGAMALGLPGLASYPARAEPDAKLAAEWPGPLQAQHRQLVDAYAPNEGFPLAFAYTFLATNGSPTANSVPATAVIVLRHAAFPIALEPGM